MSSLLKDRIGISSSFMQSIWNKDAKFPITRAMHLYFQSDDKLAHNIDLASERGQCLYISWLIENSSQLVGLGVESHIQIFPKLKNSVNTMVDVGERIQMPALFYVIWLYSGDIKESFDLTQHEQRAKYIGNLVTTNEFIKKNLGYFTEYLCQYEEAVSLPLIYYALWLVMEDLNMDFDITKEVDRLKMTGSIFVWIPIIASLEYTPSILRSYFLEEIEPFKLSRLYYVIWLARADLQQAFVLEEDPSAKAKLINWIEGQGKKEILALNLINICDSKRVLSPINFLDKQVITPEGELLPGVNLVGYPFARSGLAHLLRMMARVFKALGIPFCVIETPVESPSAPLEDELKEFLADRPRYQNTIVALPCSELLKLFAIRGDKYFQGQYVVGKMAWELPNWPKSQLPILNLIDEFWGISEFNVQSLQEIFPRKIQLMPPIVLIDEVSQPNRSEWNIPEESFVFCFTYDGLSTSSRKNPQAVIDAFMQAFSSNDHVSLVVKTMHGCYDPFFNTISELAQKDKRVIIINESLDKEKLIQLFAACDIYVSLHRAEGFGLTLAESMLLNKPVITSNYSGNLDFCNDKTAYLVKGELVPVKEGEYFSYENQQWYNPSIEHAAQLMMYCFENQAETQNRGNAGKEMVSKLYGLEAVEKKYLNWYQQRNT